MTITTSIILVAVIVGIIIIAINGDGTDNLKKELERLKLEYEAALQGLDRKAALKAGRSYYAVRRKDKTLSIYDEQAIANDLSTMPQEVYFSKSDNTDTDSIPPESWNLCDG